MPSALLLLALVVGPQQPPTTRPTCESFAHPLFGSIVCAPGDADGDGTPDLIVADPCWEGSGSAGRAWLVSGRTLDVLFERTITGCTDDSELAIHAVIDANGDGARDWLLSPSWFGPAPDNQPVLVSGRDGGILLPRELARPVSVDLGDIDGDGVRDRARRESSSITIVSGKAGKVLRIIEPPPEEGWSNFGASLAAIGDVDGDRCCDLAIGAPEWGVGEGRVRAYSSATGARLWTATPNTDAEVWHWGRRLVAIGDLDGDGISELAVATWHMLSHDPGRAFLVSGKDGGSLATFRREGDQLIVTRPSPGRK